MTTFLRTTFVLVVSFIWAAPALQARTPLLDNTALEKGLGGHVIADVDGKKVSFPSLKTEIDGDIQGDLAVIRVRQTFANPSHVVLNARYLFPLNKDAAVHAMEMQVGDERVTAKIAKRQTARQTFERAKREGKSAALLEQQRPNMFTQDIANLMPGQPVTITITYSQAVPRIDAAYELRIPLVVGPRYVPKSSGATANLVTTQHPDGDDDVLMSDETPATGQMRRPPPKLGAWKFTAPPKYPEVSGLTIPTIVDKERVSINVHLTSDISIGNVNSATHALSVLGDGVRKTVTLAESKTIDNRDFVLRYTLAGNRVVAGVLVHKSKKEGTFSLLIEPPKAPQEGQISAREIVFVLDASGSMRGKPMAASKTFMRHALQTLRPRDYFRIIRFSNQASEFSGRPAPATPANLTAGTAYVNSLSAGGGTEMLSGLRQAYGAPPPENTLRIVVFLSDGYIGNEAEILNMVARSVGTGRLYAFGVGTSVNRYLIAEMARLGRGMSRIIDPTMDGNAEAIKFASTLKTPVLTDIKINWNGLKPKDVSPDFIPDLFEGDSIRVQGRFSGGGVHTIKVLGKVNGAPVTMPLQIDASAVETPGSEAIPYIWARTRVADHMRDLMVPPQMRRSGLTNAALEDKVTELGLKHAIVTQWTSFVAISERIVNPNPQSAVDADVPLPMVKGVGPSAYPRQNKTHRTPGQRAQLRQQYAVYAPPRGVQQSKRSFSGGATPEPQQISGVLLLLLTFFGFSIGRSRSRRL